MATNPAFPLWTVLALVALASVTCINPNSTPIPTTDSLELVDDKDFNQDAELVTSCASCRCTSKSSGIVAKCENLDFRGRKFQGIINRFEVTDAVVPDDGLFFVNHSLASLGLKDLTSVQIVNSSLAALNVSTFAGLPKLVIVNLADNKLMYLHPDTFINNTELVKLVLKGNALRVSTQAGENLLKSQSLTELDLSGCDLKNLFPSTFSRLPRLSYLSLANTNLSTLIPGTLSPLQILEELDLSRNNLNQITTDMFAANVEMTDLKLSQNSIQSLNGVEITGLDNLDISENLLETIDNMTFNGFPSLTRLNISSNAIRSIDKDAFSNLIDLQFLDISGNDLEGSLDKDVFKKNTQLGTLNLSDNPSMESLPKGGFTGNLDSLFRLDLSYTGLKSLDKTSFTGMSHLASLFLSANDLTRISAGVFRQLSHLVTLDLSKNKIHSLDADTFQSNEMLKKLVLSGNPLQTISPALFTPIPFLRVLDLSNCQLKSLWHEGQVASGVKAPLSRLQHLYLEGNNIEMLRVSDLEQMEELIVLDITNNPLKCSKELFTTFDWLVTSGITPRPERRASQDDEEDSLRSRWSAVYDAMCGKYAYETERDKVLARQTTTSVAPAKEKEIELQDIKFAMGIIASRDNIDEDSDSEEGEDKTDDAPEDDDDEDDEEDDSGDEDGDDFDDPDKEGTIIRDPISGQILLNAPARGNVYFWPMVTVGVSVVCILLVMVHVIMCMVRNSRARRNLRYTPSVFGALPPQPKTFGGIPGSFIKTMRKDGKFGYKKLYEETTTPTQHFSGPRTFRFPLEPRDDPSRV